MYLKRTNRRLLLPRQAGMLVPLHFDDNCLKDCVFDNISCRRKTNLCFWVVVDDCIEYITYVRLSGRVILYLLCEGLQVLES